MMNKKLIICLSIIFVFIIGICVMSKNDAVKSSKNELDAVVLKVSNDELQVYDDNNIIYTFVNSDNDMIAEGDMVKIKYSGKLNTKKDKQEVKVISCALIDDKITDFNDNGMFSSYYTKARGKLNGMTLDEKLGQILLVRVPLENKIEDLKKYHFGGYVLYKRDFDGKTKKQVIDMINEFQKNSKIPLLIATDEEGGKVVRLSDNPNLVSSPFKSPSELYKTGGMDAIKEDTINKSKILGELGINVNLAPVVDVATDENSYIYDRTIKEDTTVTSKYAKTVIENSLNSKVSYVLKHFPGYGDNADTHKTESTDNRTYSKLMEDDIPPFRAGIKAGAEAVLISHNIVPALDSEKSASISIPVHNFLRSELDFTGIAITDDLDMAGLKDDNYIVNSVLAGNDLLIVTDYEKAITNLKKAVNNGNISESSIDKMALRVLAWKYYKGLIKETEK